MTPPAGSSRTFSREDCALVEIDPSKRKTTSEADAVTLRTGQEQPVANHAAARSKAFQWFTCMLCKHFVIEKPLHECCDRTLCARCHAKLGFHDARSICCHASPVAAHVPANGSSSDVSLVRLPGQEKDVGVASDAVMSRASDAGLGRAPDAIFPSGSTPSMEALIAGLAELVTSDDSPFNASAHAEHARDGQDPPEELGQPHATHGSALENIRQYTPPLPGVPYVQLLIDTHSFPVRTVGSFDSDGRPLTYHVACGY